MSLKFMGKKLGMTRIFNEAGEAVVCTVLQVEPNVVVQIKTPEKDGYSALQLGFQKVAESKRKNVTKPLQGHFAKAKVEPRRHLLESQVEDVASYEVGQELGVDYFTEAPFVDVIGRTKGKGYQGVMKRHGFRGGPAAHGSGFHRHAGSTGMRSTPGRCLPGVKMAGHMGDVRSTVESLKVVQIDAERGLILVKGGVPGANGSVITIRKSMKRGK